MKANLSKQFTFDSCCDFLAVNYCLLLLSSTAFVRPLDAILARSQFGYILIRQIPSCSAAATHAPERLSLWMCPVRRGHVHFDSLR